MAENEIGEETEGLGDVEKMPGASFEWNSLSSSSVIMFEGNKVWEGKEGREDVATSLD